MYIKDNRHTRAKGLKPTSTKDRDSEEKEEEETERSEMKGLTGYRIKLNLMARLMSGSLENTDYPFINITLRSTLTLCGGYCLDPVNT